MNDYMKFRGKCREMSEELVKTNPDLTLVRGYYHCPLWGKQAHWWCKDSEGNIIDPSVNQFPTSGMGAEYEEFDGTVECSNCGSVGKEEEFKFESNYAFCSGRCYGKFVGIL